MSFLRIVAMSVAASTLYGVLHDQITARVSVEYFMVGHVRLIQSDSPTVLGLFWGVVATWWVGLPLGSLLATASRVGRAPPLTATELVRPLGTLLGTMYLCAFVAGAVGFVLAHRGAVQLPRGLAEQIPVERHARFIVAWWAHLASYASGVIGGVVLSGVTYRRRWARVQSLEGTRRE
jgi:membrane associated rhomboid family serine protease